jgi:hypothetical protein
VEVTAATRVVNGVTSREVHDQVFVNGELTEDTYDWYAQDGTGGGLVPRLRTAKELDHGNVTSTARSWEWGKDGALPWNRHGLPTPRHRWESATGRST